jgi:AhpD family alkylhydroperoxidase
MARLPYADLTLPDTKPLVDQITAERGNVLHLYQMLLHSPEIARGWLTYLTAIRQRSSLPGALREMVIMRVALLNGAPYEADQHGPIALKEGMTQAQLDALGNWTESSLFNEQERAVLAYTDSMTRQIQVPADISDAVKSRFDAKQMVELTATIAAYNMVSRFLEALDIHSDDQR